MGSVRGIRVGLRRSIRALGAQAILVGYLVHATHENAARPVYDVGFDAGGDQSHDAILQQLAITGFVLVPDHHVDREAFQAPVRMRLHELAHQVDMCEVPDLQQHDRQVS
jgi:hypothetical protein